MSINNHSHMVFARYAPKRASNHYCQHIIYSNGKARVCEEPSHGRTYCKSCAPGGALTATDRRLTDAQIWDATHPWRKQMKL